MESAKSLFCCLIPGLRRNPNRIREPISETAMEKRRHKLRELTLLRVSKTYNLRKAAILDLIVFDYSRMLVVWSPTHELLRAEVISKLHSLGKLIHIQDKWSMKDDGTEVWKGVIADFATRREALAASVELPKLVRHARATVLKTALELLADCELLYLQSHKDEEDSTKLVICRKIPFRSNEVEEMHNTLASYGNMQTLFINHRQTTIGVICEVTYPYFTQAYFAYMMMNEKKTYRGTLMAVLEKIEKNDEIIKEVQDCIVYLHQCWFPKWM